MQIHPYASPLFVSKQPRLVVRLMHEQPAHLQGSFRCVKRDHKDLPTACAYSHPRRCCVCYAYVIDPCCTTDATINEQPFVIKPGCPDKRCCALRPNDPRSLGVRLSTYSEREHGHISP
ncbi:unnamed protein product [Ectocarpus sp. 12 AP-2014]